MTDFSPAAVNAALARRLEQAIDKILDEPAAEKSFPVQIGLSMVRQVVRALRSEQPPATVTPLRRLAIVGRYEDSQALRERQIERGRIGDVDDCPACISEEPPNAG